MDKKDIELLEDAFRINDYAIPLFVRAGFKCELCGESALATFEDLLQMGMWYRPLIHHSIKSPTDLGKKLRAQVVICPACQELRGQYWDSYKAYISDQAQKKAGAGSVAARAIVIRGMRRMVRATRQKQRVRIRKARPLLYRLIKNKALARGLKTALEQKYRTHL